jgi:hypothetical protein
VSAIHLATYLAGVADFLEAQPETVLGDCAVRREMEHLKSLIKFRLAESLVEVGVEETSPSS